LIHNDQAIDAWTPLVMVILTIRYSSRTTIV
jgi:hypothetical protein